VHDFSVEAETVMLSDKKRTESKDWNEEIKVVHKITAKHELTGREIGTSARNSVNNY
jgi:hypothetical protein